MNVRQLSVKLFAKDESTVRQETFIPVFHRWIRENKISNKLLIDVADYRHVVHGPGVMLIAHEAHYAMDESGGRLGLRYARKRDPGGSLSHCLTEALGDVLTAGVLLEEEPDFKNSLKFGTGEIELEIQSRLESQNSQEAALALGPELEAFFLGLFPGSAPVVRCDGDSRRPMNAHVTFQESPSLSSLRDRIS